MKKRLLSLTLIFVLIISLIVPSAAALPTYLSLGDSIAAGYGLSSVKNESFSNLFANDRYQLYDLAVSGIDTTDLYNQISAGKDSPMGKILTSASLITISIGGNNFLKKLAAPLSATTSMPSQSQQAMPDMTTLMQMFAKYFTIGSPEQIEIQKSLDEGLETFKSDFEKIIAYIKNNSKAKIVVFTLYNPYKGFDIADFEKMSSDYVGKMNKIITDTAKNSYTICDLYTAFDNTGKKALCSSFSPLNFDPHPNKDGHTIIAGTLAHTLEKSIYFLDTDAEKWAVSFIDSAYEQGILKGTNTALKLFSPSSEISNCDLAVLMARVLKLDTSDDAVLTVLTKFGDTSAIPDYAINSVKACYKAGLYDKILENVADVPMLYSNRSAKRIDIINMLYKVIDAKQYVYKTPVFTDLQTISRDLYPLLSTLYEYNIFTGNPDKTLNPNGGLKRAQIAKVLVTLLENEELMIKK